MRKIEFFKFLNRVFGEKNRVLGKKSSFLAFRQIEFFPKRTKKKPGLCKGFSAEDFG